MAEREATDYKFKFAVSEETEERCSIDVQVKVVGVDLEVLKSLGKTFTIKSREYSMSRFGTWAFQEVTFSEEEKSLESGGIMAILTWGFLQISPEIDVWVKGLEELIFTFHVRQSQQKDMLRRISSGTMAKDLEKELRQRLPNSCKTLRIKLIKILCGTTKNGNRDGGKKEEIEQMRRFSTLLESESIGELMHQGNFERAYVCLKVLIEDDVTDTLRLEFLIRLAICSLNLNKTHEGGETTQRVLNLLNKVEIAQSEIPNFYLDIVVLMKVLETAGSSLHAAKIGLAFSKFTRKWPNTSLCLHAVSTHIILCSVTVKMALQSKPMNRVKQEIQGLVKKIEREVEYIKNMTGCNQLQQAQSVYFSLYLVESIKDELGQSEGLDIFGRPAKEFARTESAWADVAKVFSTFWEHSELSSHRSDMEFLDTIREISRRPSLLEKRILDPRIAKLNELLNGGFYSAKGTSASARKRETEDQPNWMRGTFGGYQGQKAPIDKKKEAQKEKEKGNEAYKNKEFRKALTHYDKAIELDPSDALLHTNKASVYIEQKQLSKAKSSCLTAMHIVQNGNNHDNKDVAKVVARLARVEFLTKRLDAAMALYQKSLRISHDPKVHLQMKECEEEIIASRFMDFMNF